MIMGTTLSIKKIKPLVDELVEQKLYDLLGDPDEGLVLKSSVKKRLEKSLKTQSKGITAKKLAEKLGLKW